MDEIDILIVRKLLYNSRLTYREIEKFLYVSVILKNISELQDVSSFVSRTGQISEPTVGILNMPYLTQPEPLTSTDYQVLKIQKFFKYKFPFN